MKNAEMNAERSADNGAEALAIAIGSTVTLNFAIELEDGSVVDGNFDRAPARLQIGDGTLPEGFERCLLGLRAGDERRFPLRPEQAFGLGSPANVMTLQYDQLGRLVRRVEPEGTTSWAYVAAGAGPGDDAVPRGGHDESSRGPGGSRPACPQSGDYTPRPAADWRTHSPGAVEYARRCRPPRRPF